ncbi:MAG: DUF2809 domain-containing protein [Candidatus Riflebacteria bacterium]|nr:DUF2809 domain-containing protein [Candidatus Riflebacteria bacterium]
MKRRLTCLALIPLVILAGLWTRSHNAQFLHEIFGKYPGDALWTVMAYLLWVIVFPSYSAYSIGAIAIFTSFIVEFSQLYQAPWIQTIRHSTLGHLILGSTFNVPDFVAYMIGGLVAVCCDPQKRQTEREPIV